MSTDEFSSLDTEAGHGNLTLAKHTLSIAASTLSWSPVATADASATSVALADVMGAHSEEGKAGPTLVITAYPRKSAGAPRKKQTHCLPCAFPEQAAAAATAILKALYGPASSHRRLVLVNPFGGGGKAPGVWQRLQAILAPSGLSFEVLQTTHAGHARELMETLSLDDYHCVCTVSGDGLVYEVINGLMARADGKAALEKLPLAPAPGGTGNALWRSICHRANEHADVIGAAFVYAKGRAAPLDLWEYVRPASDGAPEARLGWSMLSLSWGLIADVDLESEVIRFVGSLRNTLYALWRIVSLRKYGATLEYLDAEGDQWQTVEADNWIGLWACNTPWMSEEDMAAPNAELANGALDVLALVGSSRWQLLSMFLQIGEGKHLGGGGLKVYRAKAFRLHPRPRTPSAAGLLALDGEPVPFGPIEARAHPSALRVMVPE